MSYELQKFLVVYGIKFVRFVNLTIIIYFFAINSIYLFQLIFSRAGLVGHLKRLFFSDYTSISTSSYTPPISVIMPAFNEEASILDSVDSLRKLDYPEAEIIVINDGSTDSTLDVLKRAYNLEPIDTIVRKVKDEGGRVRIQTEPIIGAYRVGGEIGSLPLIVVDKLQGGKADALNAGILVSRYPYVCSVDADSMLERDALLKVVKPIVENPEMVVASGGVVRVANGCEIVRGQVKTVRLPNKRLPMFQIVEYLRAFLGARFALGQIHALLIISGVFALFRKDIVIGAGGYNRFSLVEDMELVVDIHRYMHEHHLPYTIVFVPDPIAWTEVPDTLKSLAGQRVRWHQGLMEVLLHNRNMLFNPKYGSLGFVGMPYYFIFEMMGPAIELFGYIAIPLAYFLGILQFPEFVLFIIAAFLFGTLLSIFALLLMESGRRQYETSGEIARLAWYGLLDNIIYRPLISVLRFIGIIHFYRAKREWGEIERRGFTEKDKAA